MPLRSRAPLGLERLRGLWTPMRPFHSRSWTKERPGELDEVTERCCAAGRDGCTRIPPHSKYFQGYTLAFFGQNSLSYAYVCTCTSSTCMWAPVGSAWLDLVNTAKKLSRDVMTLLLRLSVLAQCSKHAMQTPLWLLEPPKYPLPLRRRSLKEK